MAGLFDSIIRSVLGSSEPEVVKGPPQSRYPDPIDVAQAQQSDFDYGTGNEAYNAGRVANTTVLPGNLGLEMLTDTRAARPSKGTPVTADDYARAQLAINRSPIAGLGYDPHRINLDTSSGTRGVATVGAYSPETDTIYSNAAYPSNLVHESLHRGLTQLYDEGVVPADVRKQLPTDQERLVRYIMASIMGDPEKGRGPGGDAERLSGLRYFGADPRDPTAPDPITGSYYTSHRDAVDKLNQIAAQQVYRRRPGGPR